MLALKVGHEYYYQLYTLYPNGISIDHEAREIMYLVASIRLSVHLSDVSWLKRLTYDLDFGMGVDLDLG